MQHPVIGHDEAKSAVTFREMRKLLQNVPSRCNRSPADPVPNLSNQQKSPEA